MQRKGELIGVLFYIFITLLLGMLAVLGIQALWQTSSLLIVSAYSLLFIVHIALYWLNLRLFQDRRWMVFYHLLQAVLIVVLSRFPYQAEGMRINILGSTTICMIGVSLGLWGNSARSLFLSLSYAGLGFFLLFFMVERNEFWPIVTTLLVNGGFIVLFMVVLNQQFLEREKAQELAESLESANAKLAASAARIESLTLQNERQRMARELHDTLSQGVAGLVLQLEAVKAHLASNRTERAASIVDQALGRARSTLAESRAAIDDLRAAPANLAESVHEKVERFTQATGIPCELEMSLQEHELPAETAVHILSVLSEALVNVTRHAQATRVHVRLVALQDGLELEVQDNGKGFDVKQEIEAGHYGLRGMRERARLIGGTLTIESGTGSGTKVRLILNNVGGMQ